MKTTNGGTHSLLRFAMGRVGSMKIGKDPGFKRPDKLPEETI